MIGIGPLYTVLAASCLLALAKDTTNWNNVTGTSSETFPTDVGNLGTMAPGRAPFKAQFDKLNSTQANGPYGIEMRYLPKFGKKQNASASDVHGNFGPYTPWRPSNLFPETAAYKKVPDQCEIKQVHILHRHGARYPTDGLDDGPGLLGAMVMNTTRNNTFKATGDLEFMNHWNYSLGQAILVHQGAQELFDSGVKAYYSYAKLLENTTHKPVIRTTSGSRMLDSARYWALGFFGWDAPNRMHFQVIDEAEHKNNTLSPKYACKNAHEKRFKLGDDLSASWRAVFLPPIAARLQSHVQGFEFSLDDVFDMMSACAYETVALGTSEFCRLFTKAEWENFEYAKDLEVQGSDGFMGPMARALGVGWVTEFLYRLEQKPFAGPFTSQNATLVTNSKHFPVHDKLYVDFSHDRVMTSILTALNMTQIGDKLDPKRPDPNRRYRASRVTPFGARFAFEVIDCGDESPWVRAKINEAIVPLNQHQGCTKPRPDGLCPLTQFVQHVRHAIESIDFVRACNEHDS